MAEQMARSYYAESNELAILIEEQIKRGWHVVAMTTVAKYLTVVVYEREVRD